MIPHKDIATLRTTTALADMEPSANSKPNGASKPNGSKPNGKVSGPERNGSNRNGEDRNGAERNGSGRNGSERNGILAHGATTPVTRPATSERVLIDTAPTGAVEPAAEEPAFYESPFPQKDIATVLAPLAPQLQAVEGEIERLITSSVKAVADVASHTLGAGGKRLRPAITVLAAQLCGDDAATVDSTVLCCAASIEITHTTTLLHDDVVDSAEVRRGKPAANLVWGNGMSVLVGDYLFAQVFILASQEGFGHLMHPLAQATSRMCEGELLEVQQQGRPDMTEAQYEEVIALKTAALTECAAHIGALAMNAPEEQVTHLARYGYHLGLGFQIVDDVFDIVATRARIGKPVGNDIREGTITLPMLRALQVASPLDAEKLRGVVGKTPIEEADVATALQIIRATDAVEYAMKAAQRHIAAAKEQLVHFPQSAARTMLEEIADYVLSRDK